MSGTAEVVDEWDMVAGDTGHHALRAADGEDKNLGEQLVDDGLEEATHDQMLEARIRGAQRGRKVEPSQRHRCGGAAGENETRIGFDRAVSPDPKFFNAPLSGIAAGRLRRAIDAGCKPDEMASCAYELVLRNLRPEGLDAGIQPGRSGIRLSF